MNILTIAQIIGTVSIFLLFSIKLYIVGNDRLWAKSGRTAALWTIIYVFFLFILRLITLANFLPMDQIRLMSNFAAPIPLTAVIIHLIFVRHSDPHDSVTTTLAEAKKILGEAKMARSQAHSALHTIEDSPEVLHQISKKRG